MENGAAERRLTTILAADIVGYSRMMAVDEAGTLNRIKRLRAEVIEPHIQLFNGRTVKLMGDGALMEFGSVVNAVRYAIDVQKSVAEWNRALPEGERILLRIGINTGDVLVEGDDIYGDGVNVAARLEALAEPGGLCVSGKVYEEIGRRIDAPFEDLGQKQVKNIPNPVQVYRLAVDGPEVALSSLDRDSPGRSKQAWPLAVNAILAAVILVGIAAWLVPWDRGAEVGGGTRPDRPSIVVLPFANMSADPEQEYFADGMSEDLITDLAKISSMFVISRNSAFAYKDKSVDVREVAEELGVQYVLEGSVRRVGDQIRINAQLIDAETGGHLWAERYDGQAVDIFALQDKVTGRIVDALELKLLPRELRQMAQTGTESAEAYDAYLAGRALYHRRTPGDNARAVPFFERAIELDPGYVDAYTALAKVYMQAVIGEQAYADELGIFWTEGYIEARRLLEKGVTTPNADYHVLRSWLALRKHQQRRAVEEAEKAVRLGPNDVDAMEALGEALIYAGRPGRGAEYARQAEEQNPLYPGRPLYLLGLAAFAQGNSERAVEYVERAIRLAPDRQGEFAGLLAAAYGELGKTEQAAAAFDDYNEGFLDRPARAWTVYDEVFANPRIHTWQRIGLAWAVYSHPFANAAVLDRLAAGFRAAGASEGIGGYLPLDVETRLSGEEIESSLFGETITGSSFWLKDSVWRQTRRADGEVEHSGYPIHPGLGARATGTGRVRDDLLCEKWPGLAQAFEICVAIFRVPDPKARIRWGDYVMVTETGPHPFSVAK